MCAPWWGTLSSWKGPHADFHPNPPRASHSLLWFVSYWLASYQYWADGISFVDIMGLECPAPCHQRFVPPWTLVCRYSPPLTRNPWSFFQGKLYPSYLAIMMCTSLSVFMLSCFYHTSARTNLLLTIYYMPDTGMHRYEIINVIFTLSLSWHNALAHQRIATMD